MKEQGFPRVARITKKRDFAAALRRGKRVAGGSLVLVFQENGVGSARLGIVAGRRVGPAVQRNRLRRVVRDYFRTHRGEFPGGFDSVVMAQPGASELSNGEVRSLLGSCLSRARRAAAP